MGLFYFSHSTYWEYNDWWIVGNDIDQQDRNHRGHDKCRHQPDPDALPVRFEFAYFSHGRLLRRNHRSFFCIGRKRTPFLLYMLWISQKI